MGTKKILVINTGELFIVSVAINSDAIGRIYANDKVMLYHSWRGMFFACHYFILSLCDFFPATRWRVVIYD